MASGYTRVILAGLALHYMSFHPKYCTLAYCISCLLDAADGHAARALGQTSKFGAVLDMVTDRYAASQRTSKVVLIPALQMHNVLPAYLPRCGVSELHDGLPAAHHARLFESLHAYVQVRIIEYVRGVSLQYSRRFAARS